MVDEKFCDIPRNFFHDIAHKRSPLAKATFPTRYAGLLLNGSDFLCVVVTTKISCLSRDFVGLCLISVAIAAYIAFA